MAGINSGAAEGAAEAGDGLRRDIGFTGSAFLSFNGVIGASIFALPASLYADFGAFSPWLFPLFGLLVLVVAIPFAKVAGHFSESGGPVAYGAVFGPLASFQLGWIYYVARTTALAANANVFVTYVAAFAPWLKDGLPRALAIVALVALLTFANIVGVKRAIRLLDALTILKATPLLLMALWGLTTAGAFEMPTALPALGEVEVAALLVLYAFVGFENSVVPAGETADPKRTIPRALLATIVATAGLYFIVQLAYVSVMAPGEGGDAPLVEFGRTVAGPLGAAILTAAALFSLGGNLSGNMTATPRATYALARDGLLPGWFGRISPRFSTPANSILFLGVLAAVLAISSSFVWLAVASTLARLVVYSSSIAALPRLRRRAGEPMRAGVWALVAAAIAVCLWAALQSQWASWLTLLALVAGGSVLFALARRQAASSSAATVSSIQPPPSKRSPS
ncbi:APC family permease [Sphingosinicella sp. YJ22]|uniref:APC family permease n=1 Tax=Sphingosinicella sp. YJ22 TaxID=1104780 RepID=UPI00140C5645|nr:APC family permease [Sphingosinicella sp. YJ22]